MRIALIPPIDNLDYTYKGQMGMALTQIVLTNQKYCSFYRELKMYKILDNGCYEDKLQGIENVIKAAEAINANEIILPDIVGNSIATMESTTQAIKWLDEKGLLGKYKLMAVPQGGSEAEWWNCFAFLSALDEVNVIGLSKLSCPMAFKKSISQSRLFITQEMEISHLRKNNKEYHLLGGSFEILDEMNQHPGWVRSIDTSAPFEFGKARQYLRTAKSDLPKKADLFQSIKQYNRSYVEANVNALLEVSA